MKNDILNPGYDLTLRPMRYPHLYDYYLNALKNHWSVQEVSFNTDVADMRDKLTLSERHVVSRLVAFFATGDTIVANNLVLNLYKHVNSPEARMYYGRQLFEEMVHVQGYLTLLDNYVPDPDDRAEAFNAINTIPSIKKKAEFAFKWIDNANDLERLETIEDRRKFLMTLITFASAIEGLFFFGAFSYVYFLRSKGLLNGFADLTNWIFRDESMHMDFAFELVDIVRKENPDLWNDQMIDDIRNMLQDAIDCEYAFAEDLLQMGVPGFSKEDMMDYLKFVADERLERLGLPRSFGGENRFSFVQLQNVKGRQLFFERTVSNYQANTSGSVSFDEEF